MKKHLLFNQSFGTVGSPNQTDETLTRENRIGLMSYLRRTLMLLFAVLTLSIANIGTAWAQTAIYASGYENGIGTWNTSGGMIVASETTNYRTGSKAIKGSYTGSSSAKSATQATGTSTTSSKSVYCHIIGWAKSANGTMKAYIGFNSSKKGSETTLSTSSWTPISYTGNEIDATEIILYRKGNGSSDKYDVYFDDIVAYTSSSSTIDLTKPSSATSASATTSSISWTKGTDTGTGATGIQNTLIFHRTGGSVGGNDLTLNDQGVYSLTATEGPKVVGNWTLLSASVDAAATSYSGSFVAGDEYAIVHRDMAYNYSTPTYVTVPAPAGSTWYVKGSFDGWGDGFNFTGSGTLSTTISLAANKRYEFKIVETVGDKWYGNSGAIIGDMTNWTMSTDKNNCRLHTGPAGDYTFTFDPSTKKLSVTYPSVTHPSDYYVYFKNSDVWGTVYGFMTGGSGDFAGWPGTVTNTTTICGETYHYGALLNNDGTYNKIIFNNGGSGYGNQTSDLSISGAGKYNANRDTNWHDFTTYTISFAGNGSTSGSMDAIAGLCPGDDPVLPSNAFEKTGHDFAGWKTNVALTANSSAVAANGIVAAGATINDIATDITLTAQWTPKEYTITLGKGSASSGDGGVDGSAKVLYNGTGLTNINHATYTGHNLTGYYTDNSGGTKVLNADGSFAAANVSGYITDSKWTRAENTTVKAQWTAKTTTITINANTDNHGSTTPGTVTAMYGSALPSFTAATGASGYSLTGYFTAATGGTKVINADGSLVRNTTYSTDESTPKWNSEAASLTLYPQYEEEVVSPSKCITFNDALATHVTASGTTYDGVTYTYSLKSDISTSDGANLAENANYLHLDIASLGTINKVVVTIKSIGSENNASKGIKYGFGASDMTPSLTKFNFASGAELELTPASGTPTGFKVQRSGTSIKIEEICIYYTPAACTSVAAPTALTCSAQTSSSLTFTWTKAANASGYTATLYSDAGCTSSVSSQDLGNVNTVTFNTLTANTTYYCKVQSKGDGSTYCTAGGTTTAQSGTTDAACSAHGLAYTTASVEKNVGDAAFTNTLTNPHNLVVTYSSNATGVATVNATSGLVSIVGAGSTTITATWAGDGTYCAGTATYTLTVSSDCTPQSLSKAVLTSATEAAVTGYNDNQYAGEAVLGNFTTKNSSTNTAEVDGSHEGEETGYKMYTSGSKLFAALKSGTFQEGDQIKVTITKINDAYKVETVAQEILDIYYDASSPKLLHTIESVSSIGTYTYTLTASDITALGSVKTIGVYRPRSGRTQNPYVYSVEIVGCREWATCEAPDVVAASGATHNSALLTVTDAAATGNYEFYYSTSSTAPTASTAATATGGSLTKTVTGLSANTTYYYWVRSNCGGVTKSAWVAGTPTTFATTAAPSTYSVTYNGNGKTDGDVPTDDTDYEEGDVVTVLGNTGGLEKDGQTFLGWSTNATASSGTFYPAGYKFYMPNEAVTLYAVWGSTGATCVTLTNFATSSSTSSVPDGQSRYFYGYPNSSMSDEDRILITTDGNSDCRGQSEGTIMRLNYGKKIRIYSSSSTTTYSGITAISFKWRFYSTGNGGKTEETSSYTVKVVGGSTTTVANAVSITGKSNDDYRTVNITGLSSLNGYVEITAGGSSSNHHLYLDDIQICYGSGASSGYTVSFNMKDHGSAIADIENIPSGSKIGAPIPEPTATDWDFGGWYKETGCTNAWNFGSDQVTSNTTLYAKWGNCAPTITTHPVAANYNQNGVASAMTVEAATNGGGTLHYQWWMKENDLAEEDGSAIPGETGTSFTPSTELLGTSYYYCVVSNDCGNVKTNTAEVTIRDAKPAPTAVWDVEEPTHGGKGFTFSVIAKNDDGTDLWDGTLTEEMLSVSSEAVLGTVTVNDETKTISGTYGVKASATSPVTFYLLLPATETFAAKRLDYDKTFTTCTGGGDGSTYRVPVRKDSEKDASNNYRWVTAGAGEISYTYGSTISSGKATSSYNSFDSIVSSDKQNLYVRTYNANIKKVTLYVLTGGKDITVESIYKQTSYKGADDKDKLSTAAYSVTYDDGSDENTGAKGNHYIVITLEDPLEANDILMFKFSKSNVKAYGAVFSQTADGGTETPTLGWSPSIDGNVEKNENAADFTYTATRSNDKAVASLGIISYSSSNTTVATVNTTTGQVTIADNIDFGSADHIDVTITATLSASGCYKKATTTYTLRVKKYVCSEAAGTIAVKSDDGCSKVLEIAGYEAGATIQWYKDGAAIPSAMETTYTAASGGTYYAITHKTCDAVSNELTISTAAATATKIVDSWYIKNGRRTPDIALVQTKNATDFTVTSGGDPVTEIGGCSFELKDDGIIYLHGTKANGNAPSDMTPGDMTIRITATACANAAPLDINLHIQAETDKPSIAFVVDGTLRKDGGSATSVLEAKTSDRPLWKYLANSFTLTGCNAYWSVDSKELRQYYSQFDAILITDDPSTDTKGTGGVSYVKAFGTMVDVRPVLTMEAYVGKFKDGGWHVYDATPTSPNPRQVEMKLECKNHDIFKGLNPASSDNVRTTTDEYGNEYWHVIMVDTTQSPYHNTKSDYKELPALQGFDKTKFDHMLGVGTIFGEKLQAGVERQEEPAARMMILGIQNNAMAALTTEGKLVVKNALEYLLKTNMEDVNDCANYFTDADGDGQWSNGANWTRGEVPDFETRARILKPVTIGNGTAAIAARVDIAASGESKHLGESCTGSITIAPQGLLKVGGKVTRAKAPYFGIDDLQPTQPGDLYLTTNTSYQSALIFDNSEGNTQAVVQVYSKAHKDGDNRYWQYLTSPLTQAPVTEFFYGIGTYTFKYDEAQNGWVRYNLGTTFEAFDAIGLTQNETKDFVFYGPLASTEDRELNLTNVHNGENMFGNSWTAPLQLTQFDDDDFEGEIEKTFYVYNTGFDAEEGTGAHTDASNTAGEWQSIPLSSLEVLTGVGAWAGLKVVPAYQAFYVKCTSAGTITLNYDKHVRPATHDVNEGLRAPKRAMSVKMDVLGMRISVENTSRRSSIYLLEDEDFTEGFDNGWDGDYFSGDANVSRFYSVSPLGRMAVSALPNLDGTALGFEPASMNEEYTFTFYCDEDKYYLNDLKMETSTPIRTGESYTFMSEEGDGANRFYISATPFASPQITTGSENLDAAAPKVQKIIYNDKLYIIRGGKVYSADGQVVK